MGDHERNDILIIHDTFEVEFLDESITVVITCSPASCATHVLTDLVPLGPIKFHCLSKLQMIFFSPIGHYPAAASLTLSCELLVL